MSINSSLKKQGIIVTRQLDTLEVNLIAKNISNLLCKTFPDYLINKNDLFTSLCRIDMYFAQMSESSACAKYSYKNNSIYFNENVDLSNPEISSCIMHECIHFVQELRNENGTLLRLGLYNPGSNGIGINEAAVQTMASIASSSKLDSVNYYNISINTISPDYYPLECALLNEMTYFTGTYPLFHSTLNSNDIFKNTFISYSDKKTYNTIEKNFDKLLKLQEEISVFFFELRNSDKPRDAKLIDKLIEKRKEKVRNLFIQTQDLIIQNCFTKEFSELKTEEDIATFQSHLYNFKDVLCYCDGYEFYNNFYRNTMFALDGLRTALENGETLDSYRQTNTSLVTLDNKNKFVQFLTLFFRKIGRLFSLNKANNAIDMDINK